MARKTFGFVWYELLTTDIGAAEAFYTRIIGWKAHDPGLEAGPEAGLKAGPEAGLESGHYTVFSIGGAPVGGLMILPEEARALGARPGWVGYIGVDDVDALVQQVTDAGGRLHRAAESIAGVGRFAVVTDPQGAAFTLFTPAPTETPSPKPPAHTPGHMGWHELFAVQMETAFAFYERLFGWAKGYSMDMGPIGTYQTFTTSKGQGGGVMNKLDAMPRPFWLFYISVESVRAAALRVSEAGGRIVQGPNLVPGGGWIVQGVDPQGVMFALVGPP